MSDITMGLNQGEVSSRDSAALEDGELKSSVGAQYLPGDTERVWKIRGRGLFGDTGSNTEVRGLVLCKFDAGGQDALIALTSSSIFKATPGTSGELESLVGGRSVVSENLSAAHYNDRWYLTTGADSNSVLEGDGTFRDMGMTAPATPPTLVVSASSSNTLRPTAHSHTYDIPGGPGTENVYTSKFEVEKAYDALKDSYGIVGVRRSSSAIITNFSGWASDTVANRRLVVSFSLSPSFPGAVIPDIGFTAEIIFEKSEDNGFTWTTFLSEKRDSFDENVREIQVPVDDGGTTVNNTAVRFRCRLGMTRGRTSLRLRLYDIRIQDGSDAAPVDVTAIQYAVSEIDSVRQLRSPLSSASLPVALVASSNENQVTVTMPEQTNDNATHWIVYRTPDNGVVPGQLGEIGRIEITDTEWIDNFAVFLASEQPTPIAPLKSILSDDTVNAVGETIYERDNPPPQLSHITSYNGRLVGISGRSLYYSELSFPESWPIVNVISSFPVPERDELIASTQVGTSLLVGADEIMFILDSLPEIIGNRFVATPPRPITGQPGLAGIKGMTSFSIAGEARAAWVSRFGIHETNTTLARSLTKDIDWMSKVKQDSLDTAVLAWDFQRQCLVFAYTRPDGERRWAMLHMAPEHQKQNSMPKITWDHPGDFSSMVGGKVDGTYRFYSGHTSDGSIYLEDSGDTDASNAYDGSGTVPFDISPGDQYSKWDEFGVNRGSVRHGDAGQDQHLTIDISLKRDSSGNVQSVVKTVSLDGTKGSDFLVNRAGEKLSMRLRHTGKARINLRDIRLDAEAMGAAGKVR